MYFPEAGNCAKFPGDAINRSSDKSFFVKTRSQKTKQDKPCVMWNLLLVLPTQKCPEVLSRSWCKSKIYLSTNNTKNIFITNKSNYSWFEVMFLVKLITRSHIKTTQFISKTLKKEVLNIILKQTYI